MQFLSSNFGIYLVWCTTYAKFLDIPIERIPFSIKHPAFNIVTCGKTYFKEKNVISIILYLFSRGIEHIVSIYLKNHGMPHPNH